MTHKRNKKDRDVDVFSEHQNGISPLEHPFEVLDWESSPIWISNMVRLLTHMDIGSSLVHATINAFYIPYRKGLLFGQNISQVEMVHVFRNELAVSLLKNVPGRDTTYVEELGNGTWVSMFSTNIENLIYQLRTPTFDFDSVMIEHLSNVIDKDIYVISAELQDIDSTSIDMCTRYKKRPSIVVLQLKKHYELMGIRLPGGEFITIFSPSHPWIQSLNIRLGNRMV